MKMSWYYRILLSYAPIFFVVISILIFSFSTVLNNSAKNQMALTNQAIAIKVMQAVDSNLKAAERMVLKEMYTNEKLSAFFDPDEVKSIADYFTISRKLDDFSSILPFANSIYLYNEQSGKVLSRSGLTLLNQFGDAEFLHRAYAEGSTQGWTNPRGFKEFVHEEGEERVITLFKYYPFSGERQGAVVVNIRVSALVGFIKDLTRYDAGLIQLFATNREPFDKNFASVPPLEDSAADSEHEAPLVLKTVSDYTGWSYVADMKHNKSMSQLSQFHDFWIAVGLITTVAGILWFTYVTHRNYKPIQAIAARIEEYTKRRSGQLVRSGKAFSTNELKYIEAAIDDLLERSSEYEQQYKDDLVLRKRQRLTEWLEGRVEMTEPQWEQEMIKLQVPVQHNRLAASVMEFDRYAQFIARYSRRDQYLLKFVVGKVLLEIAQSERIALWHEWLEPHRMAVVFFIQDPEAEELYRTREVMKRLQAWVADNLEFTVSVGVGPDTAYYEGVASSYKEAKQLLGGKPAFGTNCFIGKAEVRPKEEGGIFPHLPVLTLLAKSFRLDDGQWPNHLEQLLGSLKAGRYSQSDLQHLSDCMQYHFHKEMLELKESIQLIWKEDYAPQLAELIEEAESLDSWHERLYALLRSFEPRMQRIRESGSNHTLMFRVKDYMEMYYADPELSLNKISEHFGMNSRYLSKLFKDQFGEKFIDFMMKLRLEKARRLLLETDLPAQLIAEQVGYTHVISFHRAFKNMFGCPPGDYRKRMEQEPEWRPDLQN